MTENKNTKNKILGELESIKTLLDQEDRGEVPEPPLLTTPAEEGEPPLLLNPVEPTTEKPSKPGQMEHDVPVLRTRVDDGSGTEGQRQAEPETPQNEQKASQASARDSSGEERISAPDIGEKPASVQPSKSENPFLPKHIRDRLNANRAFHQKSAGPATPVDPPGATSNADSGESSSRMEKIVDELVERYLPQIEAELREKLRSVIDEDRAAPPGADTD